MKNLKKILLVVLAIAVVCLGFAACTSNTETTTDESKTGEAQATLTMATNAAFPPYEYIEGENMYRRRNCTGYR